MRPFILLAVCAFAAVVNAAEPNPLPAAPQSTLERLRAAAEHLKTVGRTAEAAQVAADAEQFEKETRETLGQKRQQADALLEEIRRLERQLG